MLAQGVLSPEAAAMTAARGSVVPPVVRFDGLAENRAGDTVEAVFRIYAAAEGGEALWTETQRVTVGRDGRYEVLLGGASQDGLPAQIFAAGEGRWLGVSLERAPEAGRTPLVSAAYSLKAADAETLGGAPAASFVTQGQLAAQLAATAASLTEVASHKILPETVPSGSGAANYLAYWTGAATLGDSAIYQGGTAAAPLLGIGTIAPAATLDVHGTTTLRGNVLLTPASVATATVSVSSPLMEVGTSGFNSTTSKAVTNGYAWQAFTGANNSASPYAALNLMYIAGTAAPKWTGLSIGDTGLIHFAPGQTFPGGGGAGTITGVTAGTGLTGGGTAGNVTLNVNAAALEPTLNGVYAQLGQSNTFSMPQTFSLGASFNATTVFNDSVDIQPASGYGVIIGVNKATANYALLGAWNSYSGVLNLDLDERGYSAGLWADAPTGITSALIATADSTNSGVFENNSKTAPTIYVANLYGGGPSGLSTVLRTEGKNGMCGISAEGNLACTGQVKNLVATRDGARQVETYSVQSAENWLEDYGSGQLRGGDATVSLEPEFAATVNTGVEYHVFLTPRGDCEGLYVSNLTAAGFEVHELRKGRSDVGFDYKIVAKRSGHETERLVDVTERMKLEGETARPKPRGEGLAAK